MHSSETFQQNQDFIAGIRLIARVFHHCASGLKASANNLRETHMPQNYSRWSTNLASFQMLEVQKNTWIALLLQPSKKGKEQGTQKRENALSARDGAAVVAIEEKVLDLSSVAT